MTVERSFLYRGPDAEMLDAKQFSSYLGISINLLEQLCSEGKIPKPLEWNKKNVLWPWETCLWVRMGMALGHISSQVGPKMGGEITGD